MEYATVKTEMNNVRRDISKLRRRKTQLEKELEDIGRERAEAMSGYKTNYSQQQQQAKTEYKNKMIQPAINKITELENSLREAEEKHERELDGVTAEKLEEKSADDRSALDSVKAASSDLDEVIVEAVGERFSNELKNQLIKQKVELDEQKLSEIVGYFEASSAEISKISRRSGKLSSLVESLQGVIQGLEFSQLDENQNLKFAILALLVILTIVCYRFVYPFYLIMIVAVIVLNLWRNYKILKILLVKKAVEDNIQQIEDLLHTKILNDVDSETKRINDAYEKERSRIENEIEQANLDLQRKTATAENSFNFDGSGIQETFNLAMQQKDNRESCINDELHKIDKDVKELYSKLEKMQQDLSSYIGEIQLQYLDPMKIGESFEIDPKFLMDVVDNKPIFFEHPLTSTLFLYDDEKLVSQFIRLLVLQLRVKLNPTVFTVDVFDIITIGRDFLKFKVPSIVDGKDDESLKRLFRIITSEDEFKDVLESHTSELNSRVRNISSGFTSIIDYNKFMLANDSLIIPFMFSFFTNVEASELETKQFSQLLQNGGNVGMFYHVFLRKSEFVKGGDSSKAILDNFERFFVLEENGPKSRAKDWILSLFEEPGRPAL